MEALDSFVESGLLASDKNNFLVIRFVNRILSQYKIEGTDCSDIIVEAYLRCRGSILDGNTIENLAGFFRSVCFNIVREQSRKKISGRKLQARLMNPDELITPDPVESLSYLDSIQSKTSGVSEAMSNLSKLDQQILQLRVIQGLSWDQIRSSLHSSGTGDLSVTALRKRGHRAIERLRRYYEKLQEKEGKNCKMQSPPSKDNNELKVATNSQP